VIILTTFDDDTYVFDGLRAGALGYLLKDVSGQELGEAIRKVAAGGALIEPSVARKVLAEFSRLAEPTRSALDRLPEPLSQREQRSCACWRWRQQPADCQPALPGRRHGQNYVSTILDKLGVQDRTQAALRARELGLLKQAQVVHGDFDQPLHPGAPSLARESRLAPGSRARRAAAHLPTRTPESRKQPRCHRERAASRNRRRSPA